ncbi:unnamed protein product [Scytosiphon promiscuus]
MDAKIRFCVVAGGVLLTMKAFGKLTVWAGWAGKTGAGVEFFIDGCSSVQGCRLAVYKEAAKHGARLITARIDDAISSQNGGLLIKLGFQDDSVRGHFVYAVNQWCEFHNLTMSRLVFVDDAGLGRSVQVDDYIENDTKSPPGAQSRSRSRGSEESLRSYATEIVDPKSELCVYQAVEVPDFNQKDSCHMLSHSECKGTPADTDISNRMACSTRFHRALDGTSERFPPWLRIAVKNVDVNPVQCQGMGGKVHYRFRVDLLIDFMTDEHRKDHRFDWKDGTRDDGEGPVETFVHVKDYVMFSNGVEWKYADTTKRWAGKVSG